MNATAAALPPPVVDRRIASLRPTPGDDRRRMMRARWGTQMLLLCRRERAGLPVLLLARCLPDDGVDLRQVVIQQHLYPSIERLCC